MSKSDTGDAVREPVWVVYDGRAILGDTDDASVLESIGVEEAKTDQQAIRRATRFWRGYEFALYRYDLNEKREATNERLIHVQRI